MNKYLEALDKIKTHCLSSPSLQNGEENGFGPDYDMHHDCYEDETQLLQELVDTTITQKVILMNPFSVFGRCPKCDRKVHRDYNNNHCGHCKTSLDWTVEK